MEVSCQNIHACMASNSYSSSTLPTRLHSSCILTLQASLHVALQLVSYLLKRQFIEQPGAGIEPGSSALEPNVVAIRPRAGGKRRPFLGTCWGKESRGTYVSQVFKISLSYVYYTRNYPPASRAAFIL